MKYRVTEDCAGTNRGGLVKFKIKAVLEIEFEPDVEFYGGATDPAEMLQIDIDSYAEAPDSLLEWAAEYGTVKVTGEIIE